MREVVIVSGARTAVGSFGGSLKTVSVVELGATVMNETLKRAGLRPQPNAAMQAAGPDALKDQGLIELEKKAMDWDTSLPAVSIDEVIMGNVLQAGQGQNPARQAMVRGGLPKETPAFSLNKVCGSGLKAIALGASSIMTGESDVVLAGGMENMSMAPMALPKARWGHRMELTGKGELTDLMVFDGLYEIFYGYHMGMTAENIAKLYDIGRQEQDELGVLSHTRARTAITEGLFAPEIVPVTIKNRKGDIIFDTDERPMDTNMEKMGKLRPAFIKDGTVTAGNASGINDGAAAVLMMTAEKAKEMGLEPIVKIKAFRSGGLDPAYMGLGPVPAVRKVLAATGMTIDDMEMIELNEAFASQAIGCMRELKIETEKPNELGSGISLGHPIGCTGARQMVSGMNLMKRKGYSTGLITMCIGGGMGMAMIIER
ncbi:acetyl-CoA acetyltransferase [Desulfosarcina ovata subsp. sediminis]|uniref:Acetyl-CoA acetyltransferase n=1 Tax=Desulfosarcina ovata subsp. sediminis TaxID=885957 RepID=A0A5K7ZP19_9BACT|nr:acetyl-CoA C-acetyltransferase [Desulfosarcina ovata]BBO80510.1 acetyl-CoA acetyltransferase [Desulfosarcina ovata subsp. sediminis]